MPWIEISERQRQTIAAALTMLSALFIVGVILACFVLGLWFLGYFSGVILPLVVAGVIALVTRPFLDRLTRWTRSPGLALITYFLIAILVVAGFTWFLGAVVVAQVSELITNLPMWTAQASVAIKAHLLALGIRLETGELYARARELLAAHSDVIVAAAQQSLLGVLSASTGIFRFIAGVVSWLICPVYLVFLLRMPPALPGTLDSMLPFLKPETRRDVIYLVREFIQIITGFFRCQILVAAIQGALYAIAFSLVGVPYGLAIGALMGVLNIVPFLGSAVGLVLAVALSALSPEGGLVEVAWALGAFGAVQVLESYFITPRIMGRQTGLHPLAILVAMFFWGTALGGMLGILLAVPLTAFLVVLWRLLKAKYIRALV